MRHGTAARGPLAREFCTAGGVNIHINLSSVIGPRVASVSIVDGLDAAEAPPPGLSGRFSGSAPGLSCPTRQCRSHCCPQCSRRRACPEPESPPMRRRQIVQGRQARGQFQARAAAQVRLERRAGLLLRVRNHDQRALFELAPSAVLLECGNRPGADAAHNRWTTACSHAGTRGNPSRRLRVSCASFSTAPAGAFRCVTAKPKPALAAAGCGAIPDGAKRCMNRVYRLALAASNHADLLPLQGMQQPP